MSQWFFHHQSFSSYIEPVMQNWLPAWRSDGFRGKIIAIEHDDSDYTMMTLSVQHRWPIHQAGQHIQLTIEHNGRLLTRTFTIASAPDEYKEKRQITLLIKRNQHGRFTSFLTQALTLNQWLSISRPQGDFVFQRSDRPITMLAAGSGITPIISMLTQHLNAIKQPVLLRYIASDNQHFFTEKLELLMKQFSHFRVEQFNREQHQNTPLFAENQLRDVYCCGPNALMKDIETQAKLRGFSYFQEQFSIVPMVDLKKKIFRVSLGEKEVTVTNQGSLLEVLEQQQLPVIRGCGIGVCHQCQCLKKTGVVKDIRTGQLSDSSEQLIQLCVSQPVSDLELTL